MNITPIHLRQAQEFVRQYHRHNIPTVGGKFAIAIESGGDVHGVAICGRPISRRLDNGKTIEIYRCCTDGIKNGCSMLYGACIRIARDMGYNDVITYTLQSETGASVKAANFTYDGEAGGVEWTGKRKRNYYVAPPEKKNRWRYTIRRGTT